MERISVFGLGKVGLVLSACLADSGHQVIGVDVDGHIIEDINQGQTHTAEPGVMERIQRSSERLIATFDAEKAVYESELTFVIVPTPSNTLGGFSLRYIRRACEQIGLALRRKRDYHVVAVVSTMLPGSSEYIVMPYLEKVSGHKIGDDLGYCYNPAFIALGEVVKGFVQPDYVLIGESDGKAGDRVLAVHKTMLRNHAPIARMSPIEAEITKIASNTHETMRVSFANMLFSLCTEIPGTNVDRITGALAHRMGKRFFKGATPYGGPCWPRDNIALAVFMDAVGVPSTMPRTVDQFNTEHARYVLRKVLEMTHRGESVGLLGLAYKPGTPVIERSFAVDLAGWLVAEGRQVIGWDPLAIPQVRIVLDDKICYAESGDGCIRRSQVVVIVHPLRELSELDWSAVGDRTVIDCWRCLSPEQIAKIRDYRPLGQGVAADGKTLLSKISIERLRLLTD
jgi:UDPglucose 6-dehydrogenase